MPYRKGRLWGYADTTGRVVIAPVFSNEPEKFLGGYGQVNTRQANPVTPFAKRYARPGGVYLFLNARGDMLWPDRRHAVLLGADSSLILVKQRGRYFDSAVYRFSRTTTGRLRLRKKQLVPPEGGGVTGVDGLGAGRGIAYLRQNLPAKANVLAPQLLRAALVDKQGRRLTGFDYARIHPFRNGLARFEQTGRDVDQWGLLDRQGREVLPGLYQDVEDGGRGRLLANRRVDRDHTCFILDTLGRQVGPVRAGSLYWVAMGQLLSWDDGAGSWRLVDPEGRLLLDGQVFTRIDRYDNGTVLVLAGPGRVGVLAPDLSWIVPLQAQRFYYTPAFAPQTMDPYWRAAQFVSRGRQHHVLSLRDGRTITTMAYDTILVSFSDMYFGAVRNGRHYVLNRQGREIAEGDLVLGYGDNIHWRPEGWYQDHVCVRPASWAPVVRQKREVALLDSLGRPQTAWWPYEAERNGHGCPPPVYTCNGLSILTLCDSSTKMGVGDRSGRLVIPFGEYSIRYRSGLYMTMAEHIHLFTDSGKAIPFPAKVVAELRPQGWAASPEALVNRDGRAYLPPPGHTWELRLFFGEHYEGYPFEFGIWKTTWGYVTKGGRMLWEH